MNDTASIRDARRADVEAVADILADAFTDDPVMNWTFGDRRPFRSVFRELAAGAYLRRGFGHLAGDKAATLWLPAGEKAKVPFVNELKIVMSALCAGGAGAIRRALAAASVMAENHPQTPHYYLFAVGVRRRAQGKGLGGRLLRAGLALADAQGAPAYLENSNPKNTPLYERFGFRATAPFALPAGAPPLLGMLREAGPA